MREGKLIEAANSLADNCCTTANEVLVLTHRFRFSGRVRLTFFPEDDSLLIRWMKDSDSFPDPRLADAYGLVALSYAVTPGLLLKAYTAGLFPWSDHPARWFCPHPRAVFEWNNIRIPRRLARTVRQERFKVTFDQAFREVMLGCTRHHNSSWISQGMVEAYT